MPGGALATIVQAMEPLSLLYDAGLPGGPAGGGLRLPPELEALYGGGLRLAEDLTFANFVQSVDGIVAIAGVASPGGLLSGRNEADRFVMGLLRACAGAVLIGAGTLRGDPRHRWVPADVFPDLAGPFGDLRRSLGLPAEPALAVLTASGALDPSHPALVAGAIVITTAGGAARLRPLLPPASEVVELPLGGADGPVAAVMELRRRGYRRILSEAGPSTTGRLLAAGALDDLFVTQSPVLVGGPRGEVQGLAGADRLPAEPGWAGTRATLIAARRHGSHLFLRYRCG